MASVEYYWPGGGTTLMACCIHGVPFGQACLLCSPTVVAYAPAVVSTGWQCPACLHVMSPVMTACPYCPQASAIETATGPGVATGPITVYVSIGNSDDKLSQARWSEFHQQATAAIRDRARQVFGDWVSPSADPWQNACIAFAVDYDDVAFLKSELRDLAAKFGQDSIAWAEARLTEFVGPSQVLPA